MSDSSADVSGTKTIEKRFALKKDAVGLWHAVFQAYTHVAPAGNIGILLTGVALFAFGASPLAVLLSWIIYLLMVNTNYRFAQRAIHAGGYYAIGGHGFGGYYGFMNGWTYLLNEMIIYPSFGILGFASIIYLLSPAISSIPYVWVGLILIPFATGLIFNYFGIRPSLTYLLITAGAEVIFLITTSWDIIIRSGSANTLSVFTFSPTYANTLSFFFAMLFGIEAYGGMGTVIGIGEETASAKKNVPKAILISASMVVVTLVSAMYALTIAWGPNNMASYASSPDPGIIVWGRFFGVAGEAILLAFIVNGYIAYTVANPIVQSRVLYAMARDGVLPKWLAVTHPKYHTPYRAITVVSLIGLIVALAFSFPFGPFTAAIITGGMAGIGLVVSHAMSNIAFINFARKVKVKYNLFLDVIVPIISTATLLPIIYFAFLDYTWPVILIPVLAALWIIGFALYGIYLHRHKRSALERAGVGDFDKAIVVTDTTK